MSDPSVHPFKAEVSQVLHLVVNSLYGNKEIFLRELISNASDAVDKLRFESLSRPELSDGAELKIQITLDREAGTLTVADNGIGMTEQELTENLGTIARSGTREFLQKLEEAQKAKEKGIQFIGQFGVGFYSAFLVARVVEVTSRAAGGTDAFRWKSDAKESFTVAPAERDEQGTSVVLHLKDDAKEFLENWRVKALITKYSDYIEHPIELSKDKKDEDKDKPFEYERVNQASALWQRSPKDVSDEQYEEFYKHLSHDWEAPLARRHFHVEGTQMFSGIVFLPKRAPFDLFDPNGKHGVRLHVRRVFVMDDCEELLPRYLRFIRGVVDSEDLPLNVSRETLQDSAQVRVIRKQVVNHALSMLEELAEEKPEAFEEVWQAFGAVLKEGLHFEASERERLAKLVRFESSTQPGLTTLADYVSRMKTGQNAIYYATGTSAAVLKSSPHLERLKKRGYEVLLMTDPIDPFAVSSLAEFDGKPLVSASDENLNLGEDDTDEAKEEREHVEQAKKSGEALIDRFREVLKDKVSEVRFSDRLTDSPVCLVTPEGGVAPHIERMLRARQMDLPQIKRILEVNPTHALIGSLRDLHDKGAESEQIQEWVEVLYDQALIAEGSPIEDPTQFARRLTQLMTSAVSAAAH